MRVDRRLRDERGFTMAELLVVMLVMAIVVAGALAIIQVLVRQSSGVVARTDAMQRGRLVLDEMTRQLRSQVCLDRATGSLVAGSATSVQFYADLSDGSAAPSRHTLTYDPATRRLVETVVPGSRPANQSWGPVTWGTPRTRTLLGDVVPDGAAPVFAYYRFNTANPPRPDAELSTPLGAEALGVAARIRIRFALRPHGARDDRFATSLQDDVFLRTSNPNDATSPNPTC